MLSVRYDDDDAPECTNEPPIARFQIGTASTVMIMVRCTMTAMRQKRVNGCTPIGKRRPKKASTSDSTKKPVMPRRSGSRISSRPVASAATVATASNDELESCMSLMVSVAMRAPRSSSSGEPFTRRPEHSPNASLVVGGGRNRFNDWTDGCWSSCWDSIKSLLTMGLVSVEEFELELERARARAVVMAV